MLSLLACTVGGLAVGAWGVHAKRAAKHSVYWTPVSLNQLEVHHKMTLALADRAHIDPCLRDALRHQVEVLKNIGIAGSKDEAIEVPSSADLTAYGPRTDGPPLLPPKREHYDLDEWQRNRGRRVLGDAMTNIKEDEDDLG